MPKLEFNLADLPKLIQAGEAIQALIIAGVAAFRQKHPDLANITDAQIIARVLGKTSTGYDNADALIDELQALK